MVGGPQLTVKYVVDADDHIVDVRLLVAVVAKTVAEDGMEVKI